MDSEVSFDFYDLLHDGYDSTVIAVQQDLYPGEIDLIPTIDGPDAEPLDDHAVADGTFDMSPPRCHQKSDTVADVDAVQWSLAFDLSGIFDTEAAEPLVMDHGDTDIVVDYMAPLEWECLDIDPHKIFAFPTDDCLEFEAEETCQPIPADESQRLAAAATTVVKKRRRDAADDDVDAAGGSRGAPRRATLAAEPGQLEPAPMDGVDGSRQGHAPADREPVAAAPLVSCCEKRDAANQVSEAQLVRAFGSVTTRDVSTQAPEDEGSSDDASRPERSPVDEGTELVAATPAPDDEPFVPVRQADDGRALHCLGSVAPDAAAGVSEDDLCLLPSNGGSAEFTAGDATAGFEFEDPFHVFYEWYKSTDLSC